MAPHDTGAEKLTGRHQELKEQFKDEVGYWSDLYDDVIRIDPAFFDHYRKLISHPHQNGPLKPKVKEFMLIAVNCSTTQLYNDGTRIHIDRAFERGATFGEVREVLQRASGLGIHSVTAGVQLLSEFTDLNPQTEEERAQQPDRGKIREAFKENRGYWSETWEQVLQADPQFLEHYLHLSSYPYQNGPLEPKVKEFLSIAYDGETSNLFLPGMRIHIENALELGAQPAEIMEVVELASIVGFHTLTESAPVLIEEARKHDALPEEWPLSG